MKTVNIPNYGPVSFPDTMEDDEVKQRAADLANAALARTTYTPDYRDQGLGALAKSGFKRAASSLGSTVTDLIPALAGSALGFDEYAREQLKEADEKKKQSEMENPTAYKSYKDIRGIGDLPGYVAETMGELGPDMLAMLTGAGGAAAVGKRVATKGVEELAAKKAAETVAKRGLTGEAADAYTARLAERAVEAAGKKGSERGMLTGLYGSSVGLNAPDTFQNIEEKTGKLEPGIALLFGAAQGVLDTYLPAKILKQLSPAAKDRLASEILNRSTIAPQSAKLAVAKALGTTTAGEAGTEGLQEVLGILAEQTAGAKGSLLDPENIDRVLNASIKGAIGGATFGAPGAIVEGRRSAELQRQEADRRAGEEINRANLAGEALAAKTGLPEGTDYNRPAYERRAFQDIDQSIRTAPQADMFPSELAQAKFSMDDVAKYTPDEKGASYTEALDAVKVKIASGQQLTRAEADMLVKADETSSADLAKANIAPEETAPTDDARQAMLPGMQRPDLFGDVMPERQAAPKEVDPIAQRVSDLTQEYIDSGVPPKQAVIKAYQQAQEESRADVGVEKETERLADKRQGELQFAPEAPAGRQFREEPFNVQMPDQLAAVREQQTRAEAQARAEQEAAAQKEAETIQAENQRQLQIADEAQQAEEAPAAAPAITPILREPTQLTLPGVGVRYADKLRARREAPVTETAEQTPEAVSGVVTQDMLTGFGVLPAAPIRKRLVGKDLSNPTQRTQVQRELNDYANNEAVPTEARAQVKQSLQSPLFMGQTEMFGPKGGATAAATGKGATRAEFKPVEPINAPAGESISVPSRPVGGEAPAGTRAPRDGGVDVSTSRAGQAGVRKGTQPSAVELTEGKPEVPKVEAKPAEEAKAERKAAREERRQARAERRADMTPEEIQAEKTQAKEQRRERNEELQKALGLPEKQPRKPKAETIPPPPPEAKPTEAKKEAAPKVEPKAKTEPKAEAEGEAKETKTEKQPRTPRKDVPEDIGSIKVSQARSAALFSKIRTEGYGFDKEDVSGKDVNRVTLLKVGKTKLTPAGAAAKLYFGKIPRVIDNLRNIAFDVVYDPVRFRRESESKEEADFFQGMNGEQGRLALSWVRANLSNETSARLDRLIDEYTRQKLSTTNEALAQLFSDALTNTTPVDETIQSYLNTKQLEDEIAQVKESPETSKVKKIELGAVQSAALPLHPAVISALKGGDVQGALKLLAASTDGAIAQTASALVKANVKPKVTIEANLTDADGKRVPGYYDPETDTIYLDAELGLNPHVLFHELGHAATSHTLDNKSHPLTKQLTQLFDDVKDSLDTAYGSTSLDEFVAEAWGNEEFKGKLNSINPKGEKITAWQRFTNAIVNFFRKLMGKETKGVESAYDVADRLIQAILSPAPETRNGPLLFAATVNPRSEEAKSWLNSLTDASAKLPLMNEARADKFNDLLRNVLPDSVKKIALAAQPLHTLVDLAKPYLPSAPTVNRLVEAKGGDEYNRFKRIEPTINEAEKWAKEHSKLVDTFDMLAHKSTLDEVDPSVPRETYEKITDKEDAEAQKNDKLSRAEKLASWDAMQKDWGKIGAQGRQLYRRLRDTYGELYKEIREAVGARIDATEMTDAEKAAVKKEIYARLAERGAIHPYFPLTRFGDYWVSYTAPGRGGKPEVYISAFETERERERFEETLVKGGVKKDSIQRFANITEMNYKNTPSNSFVNGVLKVMDTNHVPTEAREQVMRLFLQTLPESSFAQSFQRRKGTLGFNKDAIRAFREKTHSMSRQLTNMKYAAKLTDVRDQLRAEAKAAGIGEGAEDNKVHKLYLDELDKRISFAISPTTNKATQLMSSLGFNYLLGFNVSSAVVNLTQVPLIVLPYLGGKYNYPAAQRAIQDAYRLYARSGFERSVTLLAKEEGKDVKVKERAMPSIDNFDFENVKDKDIRKLETLAQIASEQGQLNRSMFYDVLQVDGGKSLGQTVNAASGFMFHHGERMNRQVSLIAAYNLELNRLNEKGAKLDDGTLADTLSAKEKEVYAANQAVYMTEMTNGGTAAASAPRLAQGPVGKVLFMFKRYGVSMYYLMFKQMMYDAAKTKDPVLRKQALRQLAGVYGTAAIFSGLQGLPLFGLFAMIYNYLKDDDDEDLATAMRAGTNELMYKGLLNYLTGVDVAGRVGLSDLIFRDNKMSSGSASFAETIGEMLGGPAYGVATKIKRGYDMIGEGEVERGIETMVPTALGNIMRGHRFATEGANTLRGDPIVGDIGYWNSFAQSFGFAPAEYTKQLEINARVKGIDKYVNQTATKLRRQYNTAERVYDYDGMQDIREKLEKLYEKHPDLGNLEQSLAKSKKAFDKQTQLMYHGISISPKLRNEMLELARDLED
jgi:hypothetical protein